VADSKTAVTFVIPGQRVDATRGAAADRPLPGGLRSGSVESSVRVGASRDAGQVRVQAIPGVHVVAISIDGGPDLILHPEVARELLQAQQPPSTRAAGAVAQGEVFIPTTLRWPGAAPAASGARSGVTDFLGGVVIKAVDVVKGVAEDMFADAATDMLSLAAVEKLARAVDGQVTEGVYQLRADRLDLTNETPLQSVPSSDQPMLVFIHGTFSSTSGGFSRMWTESPERVGWLFAKGNGGYDGRIYALDHATLGASPVKNALTLAKALPKGAKLHLVTHSRGGLVAEVLAQLCARRALTNDTLQSFKPSERRELEDLLEQVSSKEISVERIVRVGCPVRGTLLASKRLDAYLSVLSWTMKIAGWPIAAQVSDFLGAVARHRLDPEVLPGLAAQVPSSPLVQLLHTDPTPIPGELRIVAGDIEGDSVLTWIKTLMSDGFYWTDNDAVVQTSSMYGGARRQSGATFVLDQGGRVLHTRYFAHDRAADAVFHALLAKKPAEFRTVGPLSWAGKDSSGVRAARPAGEAVKRPAVFLIPGVGASRLRDSGALVWPAAMATQTLERLAYVDGKVLEADGFVGDGFDALHDALAPTHDVIRFPYDWRAPLEVETARLATMIDEAAKARVQTHQPVRLLTHSSGAVLVRLLALDPAHHEVWERFIAHPDARVVMLAPTHGGIWLPMQVLSGDDTFGGLLTVGAPPLGAPLVRDAFGTMPGVLQLQADLLDPRYALGQKAAWATLGQKDAAYERRVQSWHNLGAQQEEQRWGRVDEDALQRAVTLRNTLDDRRAIPPPVAAKMAIVVGVGTATPDGLADETSGQPAGSADQRLMYVDTVRGDGRVTVDRAQLPGVATYQVDAEHAALPALRDAFPGIVDLLTTGVTKELPPLRDAPPGDSVRTRSRASRQLPPTVPADERDILSTRRAGPRARAATRRAVRIQVVHGDLMFVRQPLLIGHYRSMRLTGAENVMDRLIGRAMSRSLQVGVYPDRPATSQIFLNTHVPGDDRIRVPRPEAVVVVGLGEEGALTAADLVLTIRKGVLAWAMRVAERHDAPATFDVAATLIGSGGKGMDVSTVAPLLAEGVSDADESLETAQLPRVGAFRIIELFQDRAHDAWQALSLQAEQQPERYQLAPSIETGAGALRRPPGTHYRGADYDFVSIAIRNAKDGSELAYSLDTRRARTELVRQSTQMSLLLQMLDSSNMQPAPPDIGLTLFNVLVPVQLEPYLGSSTDIVLELDDQAAGLPWELLDTSTGARGQKPAPWAIRSRIVRKLRMESIEPPRRDATAEDHVLVIGEPQCDPAKYLRLAGARREATAVANAIETRIPTVVRAIAPDDETRFGPNSVEVLSALHRHRYRIIHIAGHGEPTITGRQVGGVVLSPRIEGDTKREAYLGSDEIRGLRTIPELVFINCCHVGARERLELLEPESPFLHRYDRPGFAAGVAKALIGIGVRCVIAAGWAVDDRAAEVFAVTFYQEILAGRRFIEATATAREAARKCGGTTWAAFQCWGDPEWTFSSQTADAQGRPPSLDVRGDRDHIASSDALVIELQTLATQARFDPRDDESKAQGTARGARVSDLDRRFGKLWGHIGTVADAFGAAYGEMGDRATAAAWYRRAIEANDGTASLRAAEQLANLRVRAAWDKVSKLKAGELSTSDRDRLNEAVATITKEIASLETFIRSRPTLELGSLLGSACKRLAMVSAKLGDREAEAQACARMQAAYLKAEEYGGRDNLDVFYPAWHRLVSDATVAAGTGAGLNADAVALYRGMLDRKDQADGDFWSAVGFVELDMVEAVASGVLASRKGDLNERFLRVAERVPSTGMWGSVYDNSTFVLDLYRRRLLTREAEKSASNGDETAAELAAIDTLLDALAALAMGPSAHPSDDTKNAAAPPDPPAAAPRPKKTKAAPKKTAEAGRPPRAPRRRR
jgi:hypothetical protein